MRVQHLTGNRSAQLPRRKRERMPALTSPDLHRSPLSRSGQRQTARRIQNLHSRRHPIPGIPVLQRHLLRTKQLHPVQKQRRKHLRKRLPQHRTAVQKRQQNRQQRARQHGQLRQRQLHRRGQQSKPLRPRGQQVQHGRQERRDLQEQPDRQIRHRRPERKKQVRQARHRQTGRVQ